MMNDTELTLKSFCPFASNIFLARKEGMVRGVVLGGNHVEFRKMNTFLSDEKLYHLTKIS